MSLLSLSQEVWGLIESETESDSADSTVPSARVRLYEGNRFVLVATEEAIPSLIPFATSKFDILTLSAPALKLAEYKSFFFFLENL